MTLPRAIKILEEMSQLFLPLSVSEKQQALNLGIEALKRIKASRPITTRYVAEPLLGETKE